MLQIPIIMPQLGESIAEATVISLLVKPGDRVEADQDVLEVETNKATMNVASPGPGRLEKFLVNLNESYPVGTVLGYLEISKEEAARHGLTTVTHPPVSENGASGDSGKATAEDKKGGKPTLRGLPFPAPSSGAISMSPR